MAVEIHAFETGPFLTNTFLVLAGGDCWVIDPGFGPVQVVAHLQRRELKPDRIVLTHGHCDHVAGIPAIREAFGPVPVWCPAADAAMLPDPALNLSQPFGLPMSLPPADEIFRPGQTLELGDSAWEVLDTSGHTPGGVSLYCSAEAVAFTGDALFAMGVGRTDFPGSDGPLLLANIREKLLSLPDETVVYPGHGPKTTIGAEKRQNPFL